MNAELLYLKVDKVNSDGTVTEGVAFPSDTEQVVLGTYTYEAKRMGGAPTITDSFYFSRCLDKEWKSDENNSEVYAEYNGERFYVSSIPSPTKDNTNGLYKHEITLTSRREILDNTLFFDVVTEHTDTQDKDRYRSNQTNFSFGGDIREFIKRINDSLVYVGIYDPTKEEGKQGYHLVLKDGYGTDDVKEISIDSQYITEVIQEIYNTYNLTYYWKGEVCYVGEYENDLTSDDNVVRYGRNDALLSVSEENSNNKIVDMITGYGSSDNIPYYYPNDDEFGEAVFSVENGDKDKVRVTLSKFLKKSQFGNTLALLKGENGNKYIGTLDVSSFGISKWTTPQNLSQADSESFPTVKVGFGFEIYISARKGEIIDFSDVKLDAEAASEHIKNNVSNIKPIHWDISIYQGKELYKTVANEEVQEGQKCSYEFSEDGIYSLYVGFTFSYNSKVWTNSSGIRDFAGAENWIASITGNIKFTYSDISEYIWENGSSFLSFDDAGIEVSDLSDVNAVKFTYMFNKKVYRELPGTQTLYMYAFDVYYDGDLSNALTVSVTDRIWLDPSQNLMPSIYRESKGAERFYYALNDTHKIPGSDKYYEFKNKYVKGNPHQGSVSFDDIKPTINGIRNDVIQSDGLGQLFGEIADVAFDNKDSDVKDSNDEYVHQYFYIKLHKFSGEFGFDLFSHALASENAVINMIDCQGCPACAFPIQSIWNANKDKCYNCVSVDENGNLKTINTEKDDYILGETAAQSDKLNQNSQEKEIWIAVQKDNSTLGIVMPNAAGNFKPKKGDKFVITGIKPPKVLVTAAEHRLDEALIKYMSENNEDSFTYSIKFSRIFLAENPDYANKLNENAKICLEFNGVKHELFVSNYSVKRDGNALAEVEVELVKSLEVTQSEMKQMIDSVKGDVMNSIGSGLNTGSNNSFNAATADKMYLSKLKDDTAAGTITFEQLQKFLKGMKVGANGEYGMDAFGQLIVSLAQSLDYNEETQTGFGFYKRKDGKYGLNITDIMVWGKAIFNTLQIRELDYVGGNMVFSQTASKIFAVRDVLNDSGELTGWKCYLLADDGSTSTTNLWKKYDQAKCQTFNIAAGVYENVSNKEYWRLVTDVSTENEQLTDEQGNILYDGQKFAWIVISKTDCENENNDYPAAGDSIVGFGNRNDTDRQNIIVLETVGDGAPRFVAYDHVNSYSLTNKEVWVMSPRKFIVKSEYIEITTNTGDKVKLVNYRGDWQEGTAYGYYDEVTWQGTRWLCMVADGNTTTSEPSEDNSEWMATTAIMDVTLAYTLSLGDWIDKGETNHLSCSVVRGFQDITSDVTSWSIVRDSGDKKDDAAWQNKDKAKNFAGEIDICWTDDENDIGNADTCIFTITAYGGNKKKLATRKIEI